MKVNMTKEEFMALPPEEQERVVKQVEAKLQAEQQKKQPNRQQPTKRRTGNRRGNSEQNKPSQKQLSASQYELLSKQDLKLKKKEIEEDTEKRVVDTKKEGMLSVQQAKGDARVTFFGALIMKGSRIKQLREEKKQRKKYIKKSLKKEEVIRKMEEQMNLSDEEFLQLVKKEKEEFWGAVRKATMIGGTVCTLGLLPLVVGHFKGEEEELV